MRHRFHGLASMANTCRAFRTKLQLQSLRFELVLVNLLTIFRDN